MKWFAQEAVQRGFRKPIRIEVAQLEDHPERFIIYPASKRILTMWSLLDKQVGSTYYLHADGWEHVRVVAEARIREILNPEPRRKRLLEQVNKVEARKGANRRLWLYERVAEVVRKNPGCDLKFICSAFENDSRSSLQGALQTARTNGLIYSASRSTRYAKWYHKSAEVIIPMSGPDGKASPEFLAWADMMLRKDPPKRTKEPRRARRA